MSRGDHDWTAIEQEFKAGTLPIPEVARQYGVSQSAIYRKAKKEGWVRGEPPKSLAGRPSAYTEEVAEEICTRIAGGESVRSICRDKHLPVMSTVMLWVAENRQGFSDRYEKAVQARAHFWAEDILDIADDATNDWMEKNDREGNAVGYSVNGEAVQRSRLRVDSRKWLLSKMLPRYADKQEVDHKSSDGSMTPAPTIDASKLSDSTLEELLAQKDQGDQEE